MEKRKLEISKTPPIIITGCARSGTSLVAAIFAKCGAFGGKMTGPTRHNRKGQFENAFIRDKVEKPYLKKIGMDPLGQKPLPDTNNMYIPTHWRKTIHTVFLNEGYQGGPWFYKGAKACLIWPVWNWAFPEAKWIIVRRRSSGIANSCLKTGFMHKRTTYEEWIEWINQHEEKWHEMRVEAGLQMIEVWPDRFVERQDYSQVKEAVEWAGLEWNEKEVLSHVEPRLWNTREKLKAK